jgi:hypothetical protein
VFYSKDKGTIRDDQHKETSTEKVQRDMDLPGAWISVCCQVEVSATGRSLVQRSPTGCVVSLCVI